MKLLQKLLLWRDGQEPEEAVNRRQLDGHGHDAATAERAGFMTGAHVERLEATPVTGWAGRNSLGVFVDPEAGGTRAGRNDLGVFVEV